MQGMEIGFALMYFGVLLVLAGANCALYSLGRELKKQTKLFMLLAKKAGLSEEEIKDATN